VWSDDEDAGEATAIAGGAMLICIESWLGDVLRDFIEGAEHA
jgi:hypothetical protein